MRSRRHGLMDLAVARRNKREITRVGRHIEHCPPQMIRSHLNPGANSEILVRNQRGYGEHQKCDILHASLGDSQLEHGREYSQRHQPCRWKNVPTYACIYRRLSLSPLRANQSIHSHGQGTRVCVHLFVPSTMVPFDRYRVLLSHASENEHTFRNAFSADRRSTENHFEAQPTNLPCSLTQKSKDSDGSCTLVLCSLFVANTTLSPPHAC